MNTMSAISIAASLLSDAHNIQLEPGAAPVPARSDQDVRDSYNAAVSKAYEAFVKEAAVFHGNQECFGDELARKAFNTRDEIKKAHQAETSWLGQAGIWVRNLLMYGGANASYEGLSQKKNPEEIAYSAFKTNGADLGLDGNGFGDILNTWNAIKADSDLYPEDITPAMVAAFKAQPAGQVDPAAILAARAIDMATAAQAGAAAHRIPAATTGVPGMTGAAAGAATGTKNTGKKAGKKGGTKGGKKGGTKGGTKGAATGAAAGAAAAAAANAASSTASNAKVGAKNNAKNVPKNVPKKGAKNGATQSAAAGAAASDKPQKGKAKVAAQPVFVSKDELIAAQAKHAPRRQRGPHV